MYFAKNIKFLRKRKNRTQDEVAEALGMKRPTLSGYENEVAMPNIPALVLFSDYFGMAIDTLVKVVDVNDGYTVIPELHVNLLEASQKRNIRPIVDPEPVREISLVIRKDYVREKILNIVADNIRRVIPEHMIDARLKKFAIKI